jgi:undecaprenyl-diphosphatase
MAGAFSLDLYKAKDSISLDQSGLIAIGFVVAFLSASLVVKSMLAFVTRYGFMPFAIWRILVGSGGLIALQMTQ